MLISIYKFNCIPYKIEKVFVWINKLYLYVRTNLIIYIIVTKFLIIQYIFMISEYVKEYIIHKIIYI